MRRKVELKMDELDIILHDLDLDDYTAQFLGEAEKKLTALRARAAEADALRAERDEQKQRADILDSACAKALNERDEQAKTIETARKVMSDVFLCDSFDAFSAMRAWLAANAPTLCDVCEERPATVERDGHKFCGYCYGSYVAMTYGEEFATMPTQGETESEE